jgi:prolyl-tRNA editing enzyme YbaK/EbsC (Cys-tRNA(Pro) deacylase)
MTDVCPPTSMQPHPNLSRVLDAAAEQGLTIGIRRFPDGTRTAVEAAAAIGCRVGQIVKSLVFVADQAPVLVLVSGADRADLDRLSEALAALAPGGRKPTVRRASADEAREATGFSIGGIPPLGHVRALPVLMDERLLQHELVWAAAGLPDAIFAVAPTDLARAARARVVGVATADPSER